jgi:predicted AlkP superfamily pyrophosphatase or phosphodiesterase
MDKALEYLLDLLEAEKLLNRMNILIVSDHGMASIKKPDLFLKDYVNMNDLDDYRTIYGAIAHIYPKAGKVIKFKVKI